MPASPSKTRAAIRARVARAWSWGSAHPASAVAIVAIVVRACTAVIVFALYDGTLTPDDQTYTKLAAADALGDGTQTASDLDYFRGITGTYLVPLTLLYRVFGAHVLVGQMYSAVLGAAVAVLTVVMAKRVCAPPWPLVAGLVVAVLPSQVLWSSLTLKDSSSWVLLGAMGVVSLVATSTTRMRTLVLCALVSVVALYALSHLRGQTAVVASLAVILAAAVAPRPQYWARLALAVLVGVIGPLAGGLGPAGVDFVRHHGDPATQRAAGAANARSALVHAPSSGGAHSHREGTTTVPVGASADESVGANVRYLPRGLVQILLQPFPIGRSDSVLLRLARLESLIWYPLLGFALLGATTRIRQLRRLGFIYFVGSGLCGVYALTEGNFGTSFRHRSEVVWVVAVFAAMGAEWMWGTRRRLRRGRLLTDEGLLQAHREASTAVEPSILRACEP